MSVKAANLSDCRIESNRKNRFGSENRIESKFFCPNWNALIQRPLRPSSVLSMMMMMMMMTQTANRTKNIAIVRHHFMAASQRCRGDGISIPIPISYTQKILWVSPRDSHIHRTPKSYITIPTPCLCTTRGLF